MVIFCEDAFLGERVQDWHDFRGDVVGAKSIEDDDEYGGVVGCAGLYGHYAEEREDDE